MQNISVQTLGISEDVKMTRIYLVAQVNFFDTDVESDDHNENLLTEDSES